MWELIKIIIGLAIALMAFSFLLGSLLLPAVVILVPQTAVAQPVSGAESPATVQEEEVSAPPQPAQSAETFSMPANVAASEQLVVPTSEETFKEIMAQDLLADMTPQEQESAGVLGPRNGGFAPDVWQGVSRERAETLFERVRKNGIRSARGMGLLTRLLLTRATPPEGPSDSSWLATRATALQTLGAAEDAHRLINQLVQKPRGVDGIAKVWVNDRLLIGETQAACRHVRDNRMNTDAPYWQHALMVCQALQGNLEELRLSLRLASDREQTADSLLFSLLRAIIDTQESPRLAPTDIFNPLHAALYQGYPRLINPEVMRRLPDVSLRRIVMTPELDISLRLQAAEKLVNDFGNPEDVARLTGLYSAVEFSSEMIASPLKFVRNEVDGSNARALLWQGAQTADLPSGKALALKLLWERAEEDTLTRLPGHLSPDLIGIQPESNLAWFSPYVIKMSLRRGNLPTAKAWWGVLSGNRSLSRDLTVERTDIAMAFAMLDGQLPEGILDQWWSTQTLHNLESRLKTTRVLALIEALNMAIPSDLWIAIHHEFNDAHVDTPPGPGPIWLRLVGRSLEQGQTAEAILMLLEPLMYAHPARLPPQGVANIVAGLTYLGLGKDAKNLALEAVIKGKNTPD